MTTSIVEGCFRIIVH